MHILIKTFTVCLCDKYNFPWAESFAFFLYAKYMAYSFSQSSNVPKRLCSLVRALTALPHAQNGRTYRICFQSTLRRDLVCMQSARTFTALAHTQNGCIYGIFYQSMLKQTLACVQSHQSLHSSNTCTKWANIRHIPWANAQMRLSMRAVSPEPSLLSHMCILGVHTAYSFGQYSDETKYAWSLARAFTALIRAQNGRTYGIFHQSMLIGAWACVLSRKTCTKWAFIWHILSVKAQTCLSNCVVSSEPLLLSHMHKMGVHMAYFFSQCSDET